MDAEKLEFIRLIDHAIQIAQQMRGEDHTEQLNNLIHTLQAIKRNAIAGQLEPSKAISTLGLAREVADWIDSLDSPLLKIVGAIDRYYQTQCDQ